MLAAGYDRQDVEVGIAKLWEWRTSSKLMDPITLDFMKSERYSESSRSLRTLIESGGDRTSQVSKETTVAH